MIRILKYPQPFVLESGETLPEIEIAYSTYGTMNELGSNVVWVFHALTGSSEAADWWDGLIGEGKLFDPKRYFIVCANMLGSHYGSTAPKSVNPETGKRYGASFPMITMRDVVNAHRILQAHLGIRKIYLGLGGSMGGQQTLEWSLMDPEVFEYMAVIACGAKQSAWAIALNEAQRMAIEADRTLYDDSPDAGAKGMEAARAIGMVSYRTYQSFNAQQTDANEKVDGFKASSYQRYQGRKLAQRFNALSYISLSRTMDSHHIGRGRGGTEKALSMIGTKTLIVGIQSDLLFPKVEQAFLAAHIPGAQFVLIDSPYGHDGFLIEFKQLGQLLMQFLKIDVVDAKVEFRTRAEEYAAFMRISG